MRKLLWLIVCLMTMVMVGCSNDSEEVSKNEMIVGGWEYNEKGNRVDFWFTPNGLVRLLYFEKNSDKVEYAVTSKYFMENNILTIYGNLDNSSADVEYWKQKINELEELLKTAGEQDRQGIIDLINTYKENVKIEQRRVSEENRVLTFKIEFISNNTIIVESIGNKKGGGTLKRLSYWSEEPPQRVFKD